MKKLSVTTLLSALLLAGCFVMPDTDPVALKLAEGAPKAIIMVKSPRIERSEFFSVAKYDAEEQKLGDKEWQMRSPKETTPDYLAIELPAGTYALVAFQAQLGWIACYRDNSLRFDVEPGQVVFLGELDPAAMRRLIQQKVNENGNYQRLGTERVVYSGEDVTPSLSMNDEALAAARAYVETHMPNVTAPVVAARYSPAKFGIGRALDGKDWCQGMFNSARKEDQAP